MTPHPVGLRVGLSLSLCVRDLVEGRVALDQVAAITAGTKAVTPEDWDRVIARYRADYWQQDPDRAERLVRTMLRLGYIDQPRVRGARAPNLADGHWRDS